MTNKEQLLFQSARQILQDQCPKHQEYYFCKKYIGEDEEPRCMKCWDNYLFAIVNGDEKHGKWYIITAVRSTKVMKKKVTHWMELPNKPQN